MRMVRLLPALLAVLLPAVDAVAGGEIALEVRTGKSVYAHEEEVAFTVVFLNRGDGAARFEEPMHVPLVTFPRVRFVRLSDGREFRPYDSPFQSSAMGEERAPAIALAPGERKAYEYRRPSFVALDPETGKGNWREPRPLPPGRYEVRATFGARAVARPATFVVGEPTRPRVRITAVEDADAEVLVVLENPGGAEHVFAGRPRLVVDSKAYGSASAWPTLPADSLRVPAGGRKEARIRLRALHWIRDGAKHGLGEVVPQGISRLGLAFVDEKGEGTGFGDGIWFMVPPAPEAGLDGIAVTAKLSAAEVRAGEPVTLTVHVENLSDEDRLLAYRLAFPRECVVRIEDAEGRRPLIGSVTMKATSSLDSLRPRGDEYCRLAHGLSWDGDRFEDAPALARGDFLLFEPRAGVAKELDLAAHLATGLTPGRYRVYAGYRNTESGERFGFPPERRAGTGVVWSEPVELLVRPR